MDQDLSILLEYMENGQDEEVISLYKKDVPWSEQDQLALIQHSCFFDRPQLLRYFIAQGFDIEGVDEIGWRPLHCATAKSVNCVRILLKTGANTNVISDYNQTPLDVAKEQGSDETIKLLEEWNAKKMVG